MNKNISKILIIGFGASGIRHFKILKKILPNVEIRILRSKISKNKKDNKLNKIFIYKLNEALKFKPQISVICSPATKHIETAKLLAKNKSDLFIEKPLSSELKGITELIKIRNKYNLKIQVGYNLRFDESLKRYRNLILKGIVGDIYSIRCEAGSYLPGWRPKIDYRNSVSAKKELGGGVLLELSHEIDYLQWIFGKIISVNSKVVRHSALDIDVEDTSYLILKFKSEDNPGSIFGNLVLDFIRHDPTRKCLAIGSNGSLSWCYYSGDIKLFKNNKWKKIYSRSKNINESYLTQWKNFLKKSNKDHENSLEDSIKVLNVINSAKSSNKLSGKTCVIKNEK